MKPADFIAEFRRVMDDGATGQLWTDEEIVTYLNSAVEEACERALLLEDRTTDACCAILLQPGVHTYPLHPSVIAVKRVALAGSPLDPTSEEDLDCHSPGWEVRTGAPRGYFIVGQREMRVVPTPTEAATLSLTVYRTPLKPAKEDDAKDIEIPAIYHLRLMPWIYRCALLKHDAEAFDKTRALDHEAIFERTFGMRPDANVQRKRRDRRPPIVRSAW